jgi:hypothetical protein
MGKKYIIELEDKPFHKEDGDFLYRVKGFNSLVFDMTGIGMLTPYTEPDLERVRKEAYEKGLSDAWKAARRIGSNSMCSLKEMGFDFSRCVVADYNPSWFVVKNYSASECIEKIRQYEQTKEEIKIGDEVIRHYKNEFMEGDDAPSIFLSEEDENFRCLAFNGRSIMIAEYPKNQYRKTGRHFPEIAAVLEKMRGEQDG